MAQRCAAKAKSTGQQCARYAIEGGVTCRVHGSGTAAARAKATERVQAALLERTVRTLGLPRDVSPTDALLEEVRWTAGHVAWLRDRVQELEQEALTWGTTKVKEGGDDRGTTQEAKPNLLYALYAAERTHLVKVCAETIRAGVEERRVRLAESQGALVADAIRRILDRLGLSAAQQDLVGVIVPEELRALAGPA